jgi:hypothetical protein
MMREAIDAVARTGSTSKAAQLLGLVESTVRRRIAVAREKGVTSDAAAEPDTAGRALLSETDLRMKIDVGLRLEVAAKEIPAGHYVPEPEFLAALGLRGKVGALLGSGRFKAFRGLADNRMIYWGHPAGIEKLKAEKLLRSAEI